VSARALIADDEAHLAEHLRARLHHAWPDLEVLPLAGNGVEALRIINEEEPEVAFLDIRMPGLTGIELARRIDTRTHVVFVTAFDQYAVEAFDREVVDYLLKPVTDERLAKAVQRLQRKLASDERPPALDEVLAKLARAIPGAGTRLRWIRALKGELVQQIAVEHGGRVEVESPAEGGTAFHILLPIGGTRPEGIQGRSPSGPQLGLLGGAADQTPERSRDRPGDRPDSDGRISNGIDSASRVHATIAPSIRPSEGP